MTKPSAARERTTNGSSCNAALSKRGSRLIGLDREMAGRAPHEGRPGRPPVFADAAIQPGAVDRGAVRAGLEADRRHAGQPGSRLAGRGWPVPDPSTLRRRQKTLAVPIPCRRADGPPSLPVDVEPVSATGSSEPARGIEFLGDGAWQVRKQGPQGRRRWRQGHRAMDAATSDIRALDTPGRDGDGPVLPDRLDPIPEQEPIGTVTAEGA